MNLLEPEGLWPAVDERLGSGGARFALLAQPLVGALGVTVASEIGVRVFNGEWHPVFGYSALPDVAGTRMLLLWLALATAPFVQTLIALAVLPLYNCSRRPLATYAVFAVGSVPLYVAGLALLLLPGILLVCLAGFVSLAWWSQGAHALLGVPRSETIEFVVIALFASSALLGLASTAFPF